MTHPFYHDRIYLNRFMSSEHIIQKIKDYKFQGEEKGEVSFIDKHELLEMTPKIKIPEWLLYKVLEIFDKKKEERTPYESELLAYMIFGLFNIYEHKIEQPSLIPTKWTCHDLHLLGWLNENKRQTSYSSLLTDLAQYEFPDINIPINKIGHNHWNGINGYRNIDYKWGIPHPFDFVTNKRLIRYNNTQFYDILQAGDFFKSESFANYGKYNILDEKDEYLPCNIYQYPLKGVKKFKCYVIAERSYYLSKDDPNRSQDDNWHLAIKQLETEYDMTHQMYFIYGIEMLNNYQESNDSVITGLSYLMNASNSGNYMATFELAKYYYYGSSSMPEIGISMYYFEKAKHQGHWYSNHLWEKFYQRYKDDKFWNIFVNPTHEKNMIIHHPDKPRYYFHINIEDVDKENKN